jgi:hypothetical protein
VIDFAPRARAGLTLRAHTLTWHHALFALTRGERTVYLLRDHADASEFLSAFDSGDLDGELHGVLDAPPRARLSRRVARRYAPRIVTGTLVGLEHEYSLFTANGDMQVDFGRLIHTLPVDGVRADPADPNAYRCPWGGVLTCDGKEAEVAIPPVVVESGFVTAALQIADAGEETLSNLVPELRLDGYSTHVSVSLRVRDDRRFSRSYAQTFAPALMLLMDRTRSPGMLVRPRPGRLELCGEFVAGNAARAALAFAVGSVRALARMHRTERRDLAVRTRIEPAVERYGCYVDRTAFGPDLYAAGRSASLTPRRAKQALTAQRHLERTWALARAELVDIATADDLAAADSVVAGRTPLPCETRDLEVVHAS